jgi:hypothetical protein
MVPASESSVPGFIEATLRPASNRSIPPAGYMAALLDSIRGQYLAGSAPMALGTYTANDSIAEATAFTAVAFTITDAGAVKDLRMLASSLSPAFDQNVAGAVRATATAGLPMWPHGVGHRAAFVLEVQTWPEPDSVRDLGDTTGAVRMRWASVNIPIWHGATRVETGRVRQWLPYPERARMARVEDSVLVRFVVGADGRIAPGTPYLLHAGYEDFVEVISDQLSSWRFVPTTVGGCPVASTAQQAFRFKMER